MTRPAGGRRLQRARPAPWSGATSGHPKSTPALLRRRIERSARRRTAATCAARARSLRVDVRPRLPATIGGAPYGYDSDRWRVVGRLRSFSMSVRSISSCGRVPSIFRGEVKEGRFRHPCPPRREPAIGSRGGGHTPLEQGMFHEQRQQPAQRVRGGGVKGGEHLVACPPVLTEIEDLEREWRRGGGAPARRVVVSDQPSVEPIAPRAASPA